MALGKGGWLGGIPCSEDGSSFRLGWLIKNTDSVPGVVIKYLRRFALIDASLIYRIINSKAGVTGCASLAFPGFILRCFYSLLSFPMFLRVLVVSSFSIHTGYVYRYFMYTRNTEHRYYIPPWIGLKYIYTNTSESN